MKIVGFSFNKILAEKFETPKGKIELRSNINIKDISEEKVIQSKEPHLKFDFTFSLEYVEKIGKIELSGIILVLDDENQSKSILKDWKEKVFSHPIKVPLFNLILDKCNVKAIGLEEQLGLPFHIPFPKLAPTENNENLEEEK